MDHVALHSTAPVLPAGSGSTKVIQGCSRWPVSHVMPWTGLSGRSAACMSDNLRLSWQVMARKMVNPDISLFHPVPEGGLTYQPNPNSIVQVLSPAMDVHAHAYSIIQALQQDQACHAAKQSSQ